MKVGVLQPIKMKIVPGHRPFDGPRPQESAKAVCRTALPLILCTHLLKIACIMPLHMVRPVNALDREEL